MVNDTHRHAARLLLMAVDVVRMRAAEFDPNQPRDDQGQWTSGGGDLTPEDHQLISNDWAWPDSSPNGMSYTRMRNPKTEEGKRTTAMLKKLPIHDGVTYRGVGLSDPKDIEKLVSAKGYELNLHSSTSTDLNTAITFADAQSVGGISGIKPIIMEMHGRGRMINHLLPDELQNTEEVVAMAGTRYKFESLSREVHYGVEFLRIRLREQR